MRKFIKFGFSRLVDGFSRLVEGTYWERHLVVAIGYVSGTEVLPCPEAFPHRKFMLQLETTGDCKQGMFGANNDS